MLRGDVDGALASLDWYEVARYLAIHRALKSEPRGSRRSALVRESLALKKTLIPYR
jgi:hypothetical protein